MFGIGAQEMVLVGLICLLVFGPEKLSGMARDFGGFVRRARESVDEFKSELEVDGGHGGSWEDSNEHSEEDRGEEQWELGRASELTEDGAGDASPAPEGHEKAPEWVPAPVVYPDLGEEPRSEPHAPVYARDADRPTGAYGPTSTTPKE